MNLPQIFATQKLQCRPKLPIRLESASMTSFNEISQPNPPEPDKSADQADFTAVSHSTTKTNATRNSSPIIARVPAQRGSQALAMLLTGRSRDHLGNPIQDDSHVHTLASYKSLKLTHLWAVFEGDPEHAEMLASALVIPSAGSTAMTFVSPAGPNDEPATHTKLLDHAIKQANAQLREQQQPQIKLFQSLLEPDKLAHSDLFIKAGFSKLAHLVYMQRSLHVTEERTTTFETTDAQQSTDHAATPNFPAGVTAITWHESKREVFEQAILASYQDTADCPALLGIRDIEDIIEGHMATGEFNPNLWFTLQHNNQPVAVLLLSPVLNNKALEVVYVGISKDWRNKGLGKTLMHYTCALGHQYHASQILLAVDEMNAPATKLYRSMNFLPNARKLALIRSC
jgi:mycothiol synthase